MPVKSTVDEQSTDLSSQCVPPMKPPKAIVNDLKAKDSVSITRPCEP